MFNMWIVQLRYVSASSVAGFPKWDVVKDLELMVDMW